MGARPREGKTLLRWSSIAERWASGWGWWWCTGPFLMGFGALALRTASSSPRALAVPKTCYGQVLKAEGRRGKACGPWGRCAGGNRRVQGAL